MNLILVELAVCLRKMSHCVIFFCIVALFALLLVCQNAFSVAASALQGYYHFGEDDDGAYPNIVVPLSDGSMMVATKAGGFGGAAAIEYIESSGKSKIIHQFGPQYLDEVTNLIQDPDGYFYGTTGYGVYAMPGDGSLTSHPTFFRISKTGSFEILHTFTTADVSGDGVMVLGADGNFYCGYGSIAKITTAGTVSLIADTVAKVGLVQNLVYGHDGNLYGLTTGQTSSGVVGQLIFKCTLTGVISTNLFAPLSISAHANSLVQAADNYLYTVQGNKIYKIGGNYVSSATVPSLISGLQVVLGSNGAPYVYGTYDSSQHDAVWEVNFNLQVVSVDDLLFEDFIAAGPNGSIYAVLSTQGDSPGTYGAITLATPTGLADPFHIFHGLDGSFDGVDPMRYAAGHKLASSGDDVFGITPAGGLYGHGTLYELFGPSEGEYSGQEIVLWNFTGETDGAQNPYAVPTSVEMGPDSPDGLGISIYVTVGIGSAEDTSQRTGYIFVYDLALGAFGGGSLGATSIDLNSLLNVDNYELVFTGWSGPTTAAGSITGSGFFGPPAITYNFSGPLLNPTGLFSVVNGSIYGTADTATVSGSGQTPADGGVFKADLPNNYSLQPTVTVLHDFAEDPGGGYASCLLDDQNYNPINNQQEIYGMEGDTNQLFYVDANTPGPATYLAQIKEVGGGIGTSHSLVQSYTTDQENSNLWGSISGNNGDKYGGIWDYPVDGSNPVNLQMPAASGGNSNTIVSSSSSNVPVFYGVNETGGRFGRGAVYVYSSSGKSDFNADGRPDFLLHNSTTGDVTLWYMNAASQIGTATVASGISTDWAPVGTGDFERDGNSDILWQSKSTGSVQVWLMKGATRVKSLYISQSIPPQWHVVGTGDFEGYGYTDIVFQNVQTGDITVQYLSGTTEIGAAYLVHSEPLVWQVQGVADMNHDGHPDLIFHNSQTGAVAAKFFDGATSIGSAYVATSVPAGWNITAVCDLNGDGDNDLIWRNSQTGDLTYWYMDKTSILSEGYIAHAVPTNLQVVGPR